MILASNKDKLTFEALANIHKMEAQEEIAYLAILFTVIVGIIGFLGSAQKIEKSARILMLLFYMGLHVVLVRSFFGSIKVHSAIHKELAIYTKSHPDIFQKGICSPLYTEVKAFHGHPEDEMKVANILLLVFVSITILSIGSNPLIDWKKIQLYYKKKMLQFKHQHVTDINSSFRIDQHVNEHTNESTQQPKST